MSSRPIARLEEDEGRNAGRIRLYVARRTPNSARAEQNLLAALRNGANSDFSQRLEIIDIRKAPEQSLSDGVFLTPTLVCFKRSGQLTMTGDLADREKLNLLLQSLRDDETIEKMEALIAGKEKMLEERVALAAELNHRARNNLQYVSQLLAEHLEHESGVQERASIDAIIRHVMALAEVHDKLLGAGLARMTDLGEYIRSLCDSYPGLRTSDAQKNVQLNCDAESLIADLNTVTIIGMVLAGVLTNSCNHAFPEGTGTITVTLRRSATDDEAILTVADTGPGFTERPGSKRHGVGLVRRMLQQLGGSAELNSKGSTVWTLRFPVVSADEHAVPAHSVG